MNDILIKILIAVVAFFLRDIYNFIKNRYIKTKKPILVFEYELRATGAFKSNPRIYNFVTNITIQNIDVIPVYNIQIIHILGGRKKTIYKTHVLNPNDKKEIKKKIEIPFGESGNDYEGARDTIDESIKTPDYLLTFKDTHKRKYKQKVSILN